ncbi:hypothetical protein BD309DRAFT_992496 [Dichomitus squalens]|uniref:Uncharacterized protein n=2 Tax=Dichomitus squalens TaxID=114155 RepID=A0A4Q9PCX4_9APHY|nr:uncharacterized protein DICSQDRAFT_128172 [Dichomitus squalens LYAD-421 SS1]EJF59678.1 hypothetical protein DICSQDRAFT_128172 [Dichomitus squalens LYAD-421 SS1]TBU22827.1 hypothetical protein BD311DRAFT_675209 [Dichomitus squalens]TBU41300.1 hypothetical protein BD309DRAFT_992496 [Dichomitus squalens]TBU52680.1 hypothetical protein BD310DRAFT_861544 [Dichomitus squalens]
MTLAGGSNCWTLWVHWVWTCAMLLAILRALHVVENLDLSLMDGILRENLYISGEKYMAEIWEANQAAQLQDVIGFFDGKLDQSLSARGNELWKGQMRLLVLLRKNKIVLLDVAPGKLYVETD